MESFPDFKDYVFERKEKLATASQSSDGIIYRGKSKVTEKTVVLKKVNSNKRSLDEIMILNSIGKHSNIIELLEYDLSDTGLWMVLEFADLGDLQKYFTPQKLPSIDGTIDIVYQSAKGLNFLHSRDRPIIHRDIKPPNILLKQEVSGICVKLADFGHAKMGKIEQTTENWRLTSNVGTMLYKAPEFFEYSPNYTVAVDVFSLGLVMEAMVHFGQGVIKEFYPAQATRDTKEHFIPIGAKMHDVKQPVVIVKTAPGECTKHKQCKDLITKMTQYKARDRCSVDDVLCTLESMKGGAVARPANNMYRFVSQIVGLVRFGKKNAEQQMQKLDISGGAVARTVDPKPQLQETDNVEQKMQKLDIRSGNGFVTADIKYGLKPCCEVCVPKDGGVIAPSHKPNYCIMGNFSSNEGGDITIIDTEGISTVISLGFDDRHTVSVHRIRLLNGTRYLMDVQEYRPVPFECKNGMYELVLDSDLKCTTRKTFLKHIETGVIFDYSQDQIGVYAQDQIRVYSRHSLAYIASIDLNLSRYTKDEVYSIAVAQDGSIYFTAYHYDEEYWHNIDIHQYHSCLCKLSKDGKFSCVSRNRWLGVRTIDIADDGAVITIGYDGRITRYIHGQYDVLIRLLPLRYGCVHGDFLFCGYSDLQIFRIRQPSFSK